MPPGDRKARERAQRRQLIIDAARALAEAEGWEAVTTRRLADRIEYSQPVLYSHFANKDAIVAAVAVAGFAELATALRSARAMFPHDPDQWLPAAAQAYVEFAEVNRARYDAMFVLASDLQFAQADTPADLREAFTELVEVVAPLAAGRDRETFAEVVWAALHGLVMLTRDGRLRPAQRSERLRMLIEQLSRPPELSGG
ncbi:TetR/AcrR family transcriptional regulator [Natronosporangium hydrolyticum]|uniref:TetR/AcrR family transcriptional regulator n=1 Tax=Natronosporangium hydrolyticum TaxID=2811111 RepID=A0A895YIY9_9ACTN|nr:TetR/AcrR family transcriptional regulator [Natronosporangium hydrolyticum]QSB14556.1 TetR/AcrR family transcriptional regulator [Natronosporangium hydrolyticum]